MTDEKVRDALLKDKMSSLQAIPAAVQVLNPLLLLRFHCMRNFHPQKEGYSEREVRADAVRKECSHTIVRIGLIQKPCSASPCVDHLKRY